MSDSDRAELEELQAGLLKCLLGLGEAPEGIDMTKSDAARVSLLRKRKRILELCLPGLSQSYSREEFDTLFAQFCRKFPGSHREGPHGDAQLFALFVSTVTLRPDDVPAEMPAGCRRSQARARAGLVTQYAARVHAACGFIGTLIRALRYLAPALK